MERRDLTLPWTGRAWPERRIESLVALADNCGAILRRQDRAAGGEHALAVRVNSFWNLGALHGIASHAGFASHSPGPDLRLVPTGAVVRIPRRPERTHQVR